MPLCQGQALRTEGGGAHFVLGVFIAARRQQRLGALEMPLERRDMQRRPVALRGEEGRRVNPEHYQEYFSSEH